MHVVIPHVGKSHLTHVCVASIPDQHRVVMVDASYVADMDTWAALHPHTAIYVRPERPLTCLAHNWNLGTAAVPETEAWWLFCASDVQFYAESWRRLAELERCYPDAGIIRDAGTNWNVWLVRRWAWRLLAPMDERYKPCGGEDDDLVMKCHHAGIAIHAGRIGVNHLEGGHATRIDIARELAGTDWSARHGNINLFRSKWGCIPSKGRDAKYAAAIRETHIHESRSEPPPDGMGRPRPSERVDWPDRSWPRPLRINIGCGRRPMNGYVNTDISPNTRAEVVFDAANGTWPFDPQSAERVEAYHVIEHMTKRDGQRFLDRAKEVLRPGGTLVLECPDLEGVCARFPGSQRKMTHHLYGDQSSETRLHRWGYSKGTIRIALEAAGFREIQIGPGTDYHAETEPCLRAEALR